MRRVVITGMGVVSSLGWNLKEFWANLLAGEIHVKQPPHFDSTRYRSKYSTVIDYDRVISSHYLNESEQEDLNICAKVGLIAARQALENADLTTHDQYRRAGVSLGTTSGGDIDKFGQWFHFNKAIDAREIKNSPIFMSMTNIAQILDLEGPVCNISSACTSGTVSIIYAYEMIKHANTDMMLAGGCDILQEVTFAGFNSLRVVSPDQCKPFSSDRKGMIIGDGGAVLVLEEYESAKKRAAPILAEITGTGMSCDAYHATSPNAIGAAQAMGLSLNEANLEAAKVQYVNCHGTGTIANDRVEAQALQSVFGDEINNTYATSTKSSLGHLLGTAGSIEALITTLVLIKGTIPPMKNFSSADDSVNFKIVQDQPLHVGIENAMSNSFGFGGNNASLILSKYNDLKK